MSPLTKKAITDVTRRKLRTTLTVLGIAIGVMGLAAIDSASSQLKSSFQYTTDVSAQPDIQLLTSLADPTLAQTLQQQPGVTLVQAERAEPARWALPSGHFAFRIIGLADFNAVRLNALALTAGHLPGPGEILLESSDRAVAPVRVGDSITLAVHGTVHALTVSGFARTRGRPASMLLGTALGYMRQADVEALAQSTGVNLFLIRVSQATQREDVARHLAQVLEDQHVLVLFPTVGPDPTNQNYASFVTNGPFGAMGVLSAIALLLSALLLVSTVATLITEQVPIIGTMRAIGARRGQVMRGYLTSVALYGLFGSLVGLGLGVLSGSLLVSVVANVLTLDTGPSSVDPSLVAVSLVIGITVPLLAAALPVSLGTRITVRQALTGYGLEGGAGSPGSRGARALGRLVSPAAQTVQLGMRNLLRKRARALLTLLGLTISGAVFLSVETTAYAFGTFMAQHFTQYDADVFVSLASPAPTSQVQQVLASVPGVGRVESRVPVFVQTHWGSAQLMGLPADTQLYHKHLVSGRWFTDTDQQAVVISLDAAQRTGLKVGDTVSFHDDLHGATWQIIGIAQDYNSLGGFGTLLAPLAEVYGFEQLPLNLTRGLMLRSSNRTKGAIDTLAGQLDDALSAAGDQPTVTTVAQFNQQMQSTLLFVYGLLYSVTAIVALVGAMGLFNALAMSVLERRREIGILRALGATGRQVAQVFWTEGVALGLVAWVIALALGIPAASGFVFVLGQLLVPVPFAFDPLSPLWMLLVVLIVASLASLGPALGAARFKVSQALRYE